MSYRTSVVVVVVVVVIVVVAAAAAVPTGCVLAVGIYGIPTKHSF